MPAHVAQVWGAAFSPDGKQLVSGGSEGALRVWNIDGAKSHERELPHVGHRRLVSGVSFSPDGKELISTGHDGRIIVWDVASRQPLRELTRIAGPILASALSLDGRLLAVGDQGQAALHLVDSTTGEIRYTSRGMPSPAVFRFSPDGRRIAAPVGETIRSWNLSDESELPTVGDYRRPVSALAFFPDGKTLVAGNNTAEYAPPATSDVQQWDIATGDQLQQFAGDKAAIGVNAIDCSPDGKTVAVALQPTGLILWDVTGQAPRATSVAGPTITALAFSADGRHLLTLASGNFVLTLRHPQTGAELKTWRLASQPRSLTIAPDSRHVALGNANGTICILRID
jgi:WD40 repeat protein